MAYINIYGVNIVYDHWGTGPLRVLVARRAADWSECSWPSGYSYLAPDLPGYGRSQGEAGLADSELAEYLLGLLVMMHATEAEIYVHENARAVGEYLAERVGVAAQLLEGCPPPA